jgi:tetratricopeptide (TPR) repeat protein
MALRYLWGPVSRAFAEEYLPGPYQAGECLTFDHGGETNVRIGLSDSWEEMTQRFRASWQPDFIVLYLPLGKVPQAIWSAPVPIIGLALDWDLQFHRWRMWLKRCDLVLTDAAGVEVLGRAGVAHLQAASLTRCGRSRLEQNPAEAARDIDILYLGSLPGGVKEVPPLLARLSALGKRWKVMLQPGKGETHEGLQQRARIVVYRSRHGECGRGLLEAAAAGALVFVEAGNRDPAAVFRDREECVFYTTDNLESLLEYYLERDEERQRIAEAGRQAALANSFEKWWAAALEEIEQQLPELVERSRNRPPWDDREELAARTWEAVDTLGPGNPELVADLGSALVRQPRDAGLHVALGLAEACMQRGPRPSLQEATTAAGYFERALLYDPGNLMAGLNLAEALLLAGEKEQAGQAAVRTLRALQEKDDRGTLAACQTWAECGRYPLGFDAFRMEWERAAWEHAGRPADEVRAKQALIGWRLHSLLADLTGDLRHYYEAVLCRPDLPMARAALGCALARGGRFGEAVGHLRLAVAGNPFDQQAARALGGVLNQLNLVGERDRFLESRRLLAEAAPLAVPMEPWFAPPINRNGTAHAPPIAAGGSFALGTYRDAPANDAVQFPEFKARASLCMIVKNEENNLPTSLGSVADLFDDLIVVDTGSTDATREVAERLGARVFDFPWVDSFAAARNECLRHAAGKWIFWLDGDDCLDEENREKFRRLLASLGDENAAFVMKCRCLPDAVNGTSTEVDHVRLFRNHPDMRWTFRVHEQILPAVRKLHGEVRWCDVIVYHKGYQDPALRGRKLERDLRLLHLEDTDNPNNPFAHFNFGSIYQELGRHAEALEHLERSLRLSHPSDSIVRKLYAKLAHCRRKLGRMEDALQTCQQGRSLYADDVELLLEEGLARFHLKDLLGARRCLERLLETPPEEHFDSVDTGIRGYLGRYNLGVVCAEEGNLAEAEANWRAAVDDRPDYRPALLLLGDLYLKQGRDSQLEEVLGRLDATPAGAAEGAGLRARRHLARKEFAAAKGIVDGMIAQDAQALWPRVLLTHVLLQEGRDWDAAEKALRDVLALDPNHREARQNLEVLLRQQSKATGEVEGLPASE